MNISLSLDDVFGTCYIAEKEFFDKLNMCQDMLRQIKQNSESMKKNYVGNINMIINSFEGGKNRNKLREQDITKIVSDFDKFEDIEKYCHVADLEEPEENEFNLNVSRYVDILEPEEKTDIQQAYNDLKGAYSE